METTVICKICCLYSITNTTISSKTMFKPVGLVCLVYPVNMVLLIYSVGVHREFVFTTLSDPLFKHARCVVLAKLQCNACVTV